MEILIELVIIYLVMLQVLDGYTTYTSIKIGVGREANKIFDFFNKLGSKLGTTICIITSLKICLIYWGLFATIGGVNLYLHLFNVSALSGWYTYVVCHNYKILGS